MQFLFIAAAIVGSLFFLFQRRQFDFVSASFFGMMIYFFPGFIGYVANPYYPWLYPSIPIVDGAYVVWTAALAAAILTGILYNPPRIDVPQLRTTPGFDIAILITIVLSFVAAIWFGGPEVLSPDKQELLENIDRFFILFATSTQLGLITFVIQKKFIKAIVPAGCMVFLLFLGFRSDVALATIAIATFFAYRNGIRSYFKPTYLAAISAVAVLLLAYKPLLNAYRLGRFDLADSYLYSDDLFSAVILKSEPFITQTILNEVLSQDYGLGPSSIFYSLIALIPFMANILNIDPQTIAFSFQEQIFPHLSYGAASNIYAQFYATLGAVGVVCFVALHNLILVALSKGMKTSNGFFQILILSIGAFFAFYVHRNDVLTSILSVNRPILTVFIIFLIAVVIEGRVGVRRTAAPANAQPNPAE